MRTPRRHRTTVRRALTSTRDRMANLAARVGVRSTRQPSRSPLTPALPGLDALGPRKPCQFCAPTSATFVRLEHPELGGQLVDVCARHSAEGDEQGWWVA